MDRKAHEVFICHSSKDAALAFSICEMLEKEGINCWIAPRNIVGGKLYAEEIMDAIDDTAIVLVVFSQHANLSNHVMSEVNSAFNANKVIIPFRIDDSNMSRALNYYLNPSQIIMGCPVTEERLQELKDAVIRNIPSRAKEQKVQDLYTEFSKESGIPIDDLRSLIFNHHLDTFITQELSNDTDQKVNDLQESAPHSSQPSPQNRYDMLQNAAGEIMLIIEAKPTPPDNPRIVYDGGEKAMVYRNRESAFMLNSIAPEARPALSKVKEVLVVEIENDDVAREYKVPVRLVRSLKALG